MKETWVTILKVNRGYVVNVGCQTLVFTRDEKEKMVEAFGDLMLKDENEVREKWCDNYDQMEPVREYREQQYNQVPVAPSGLR